MDLSTFLLLLRHAERCIESFSPREESLVLRVIFHGSLKIPLEQNKQSCEAVCLEKGWEFLAAKIFVCFTEVVLIHIFLPWYWQSFCSCLQSPKVQSRQSRPQVQEWQKWCCHWAHPQPLGIIITLATHAKHQWRFTTVKAVVDQVLIIAH